MIELKDVSFTYESGETQNNLNHINLTIQDGETILLCGESGCGKTTLTRLVNGLIPHYYGGKLTGQVLLDGKELKDYPLYQIGQRVGSVFQNPRTQFYNVDTTSQIVFDCENMALPVPEMRERLEETAHSLKLEKLLNRSLFALSGGEKQKIACASADAIHPDIFVLQPGYCHYRRFDWCDSALAVREKDCDCRGTPALLSRSLRRSNSLYEARKYCTGIYRDGVSKIIAR